MFKLLVPLVGGALLVAVSAAQTSQQTTGSASQGTAVSASPSGAQAQTSTGANATQETQAGTAKAAGQLQAGSVIYAELGKSVDAKKAKQGDEVVAKTTQAVLAQGKVVIPKGSKIVGHVTSAKAHTKEQAQSELGVAFDHAVLKDGSQVPLSVSIQAIAAPAAATQVANDNMAGMGSGSAPAGGGSPSYGGGGGMRSTGGTVMNTAGAATGTVANTAGSTAGTVAGTANTAAGAGHLNAASRGAVGLSGLNLSAAASTSTQGSVITSDSKTVKLDSGTEMILRVNQ